VGFLVAEALIARWELGKPRKAFAGLYASPARGSLKVPLDHIVVAHDELDLRFGDIRTRMGGGLAGHNGLKSLKAGFGSPDFARVRIGIGRPDTTDPEIVSAYVLGRWRQPEAEVRELVDRAADAVERIVDGREAL
jgi:PTH1 family peptidyl-tRNA hydrolase